LIFKAQCAKPYMQALSSGFQSSMCKSKPPHASHTGIQMRPHLIQPLATTLYTSMREVHIECLEKAGAEGIDEQVPTVEIEEDQLTILNKARSWNNAARTLHCCFAAIVECCARTNSKEALS
jgi:hypothetical protein